MITVRYIKENNILPFEYGDRKLQLLFSYFLYKAPNINSAQAKVVDKGKAERMWNEFILTWSGKGHPFRIYSENTKYPSEKTLSKTYGLSDDSVINRNSKAFICFRDSKDESDLESLLRHLRNAIAHGYVYVHDKTNRKYIIFEDYNKSHNKRAMILFTQTDLQVLRRITSA